MLRDHVVTPDLERDELADAVNGPVERRVERLGRRKAADFDEDSHFSMRSTKAISLSSSVISGSSRFSMMCNDFEINLPISVDQVIA